MKSKNYSIPLMAGTQVFWRVTGKILPRDLLLAFVFRIGADVCLEVDGGTALAADLPALEAATFLPVF